MTLRRFRVFYGGGDEARRRPFARAASRRRLSPAPEHELFRRIRRQAYIGRCTEARCRMLSSNERRSRAQRVLAMNACRFPFTYRLLAVAAHVARHDGNAYYHQQRLQHGVFATLKEASACRSPRFPHAAYYRRRSQHYAHSIK